MDMSDCVVRRWLKCERGTFLKTSNEQHTTMQNRFSLSGHNFPVKYLNISEKQQNNILNFFENVSSILLLHKYVNWKNRKKTNLINILLLHLCIFPL